jgi:hypothetical protein
MSRSRFIYSVSSAFLSGKNSIMWKPYIVYNYKNDSWEESIDSSWSYWALRNLCAISDFKMEDFIIYDTSINLIKQ